MLDLGMIREKAEQAIPDPVWSGDVMIIDGKNLVHRLAALEPSSERTVAVVVEKLTFLLEWYKPSRMIVGWEGDGENWRLEHLPEYKGHRDRSAEIAARVSGAVEMLPGILAETVFDQATTRDAEGDDVFGTLAHRFASQGLDVAIYSNDGDLWQLVTDKITVIKPRRGDQHDLAVTPDYVRTVGPKDVQKHTGAGIEPTSIVDLKGLMGDSGDNIPGVKGVGPKVAIELVKKHGSFEGVMAAALLIDTEPAEGEAKTKHAKRVREEFGATLNKLKRIRNQESLARASFEVGRIRRDVEIVEVEPRVTLARMLYVKLKSLDASDWLLSRVDKIVRSK